MIEVLIPDNNIAERKYIVNLVLGYIFNTEVLINSSADVNDYMIIYNEKKIIVKDHFFSKFLMENEYLNIKNIPTKIDIFNNQKYLNEDVPVIYGYPKINEIENIITCDIDLFASSFFMLSRWEEYVKKDARDKNDRFRDQEALAFKFNFYRQPIVNQYIELLKQMFSKLGCSNFVNHQYEPVITHDVDQIYRYDSIKKYLKAIIGDTVIRKNPFNFYKTTKSAILSLINKKNDPYNTFDFLMDCSEEIGVKSRFYFMPTKLGELDARYSLDSKKVRNIIYHILEREHIVGIHGSWNGYNNQEIYLREIKRFKTINVNEGRQHYLKFLNPLTWQIQNNAGIKRDCSIGYYSYNGFRAGICYDYPVFDILSRNELCLVEQPMIFMEAAFGNDKNQVQFTDEINYLTSQVKKYKGKMNFLWHPDNLKSNEWENKFHYYKKLLKLLK